MGCTVSKAESQLGAIEPWDYAVEGKTVAIDEEELKKIRNDFWQNNAQGDATVWDSLHTCCNDVLEGKLDSANAILQKHGITVVSGDLSLVRDRTGNVYRIEKYCYSTPRNMKSAATEESVASNETENNKFRFRVGASFLDEEREVIYIFDKGDAKEDSDVVPKEHSPENHLYFHTYHFQDDLSTITEKQVHDKMLSTIENFPEVKGKIRVANIRLFYLGRELNRNTPFIANHIPFDSVIVVLVQCDCPVCEQTHHPSCSSACRSKYSLPVISSSRDCVRLHENTSEEMAASRPCCIRSVSFYASALTSTPTSASSFWIARSLSKTRSKRWSTSVCAVTITRVRWS